jgi:hypothetical protein
MRIPTFTESLFGIALVFLCGYFAAFNYELLGKEEVCSLDLTANHEGICQLNQKTESSVRLVVKHGGDQETVLTEVQLAVSLKSENFEFFSNDIDQKSASTGGGQRYYSTLNYGVFEISETEETKLYIKAGNGVEKLALFEVKVIKNPSNFYIHLFGVLFLVFLFFSIYLRKKILIQKYGKPLPYILCIFVALLTLSWNI